jgi:hypothetical protein
VEDKTGMMEKVGGRKRKEEDGKGRKKREEEGGGMPEAE